MSPEPQSAEAPDVPLDRVAAAATSAAYALVAADGSVAAVGEVFSQLIGVEVIGTPALASAVGAVTVNNQELVGLEIDAPAGTGLATRVEAVLSARDQRLALIEVRVPRPAVGTAELTVWFPIFAAGSPAIVWLKDLEGRYLWVNRQYTAELGVDAEWVVGHLDSELGQLEAIDGPRIRAGARSAVAPDTPRTEPLSLEYTIPGFDRRPAYAALRFPVTDPAGTPLAVCGVASPADHSETAQQECAHLLDVAAWFRGDPQTLRHAVMERWSVRALRPQGTIAVEPSPARPSAADPTVADGVGAGALNLASAAELAAARSRGDQAEQARVGLEERIRTLQAQVDNERGRVTDLEAALADTRGHAEALTGSLEVANRRAAYIDTLIERTRELEAMVASASAAGVAASRSAERVIELQREVQGLNAALEHERSRLRELEAGSGAEAAALEVERRFQAQLTALADENQGLRDQLESVRGQLAEAEARHAEDLAAHARHEDELRDMQDRVRTELNAANQRYRVEVSQLRDQHDALVTEHGQLTESEHQARADADALRDQLSAALAQLRELQAGRAAARDQIARLERAVVAATAAAAAPAEPAAAEAAAAEPPAAAGQTPERGGPIPATTQELGWDPAAQQALARALGGCLNLRSILSESVRLIGTGGGWDAVVAWLPDEREGRFSCAATWVRSPVDMARLETFMWQVRQSPTASAVGAAGTSGEVVWINTPGSDSDRHLAQLTAEGINTVVLVPVRQQGRTSAVLELCTQAAVVESAEADAALRSIEVEVGAANQRLVDAASASQWGRRRR